MYLYFSGGKNMTEVAFQHGTGDRGCDINSKVLNSGYKMLRECQEQAGLEKSVLGDYNEDFNFERFELKEIFYHPILNGNQALMQRR